MPVSDAEVWDMLTGAGKAFNKRRVQHALAVCCGQHEALASGSEALVQYRGKHTNCRVVVVPAPV